MSNKRIKPDEAQMRRHLRLLSARPPLVIQSYPSKANKAAGIPVFKTFKSVEQAVEFAVSENIKGLNVGIVANPTDGRGRKVENCKAIEWLFADFDSGKTSLAKLLALPVKPNFITQTSKGRYHAYFCVDGCTVKQFKAAQKAIAKRLTSDESVCDPTRCLRIAGSVNFNHDSKEVARIVHPKAGKRINKILDFGQFCTAMKLKLDLPVRLSASGHDPVALLKNADADDYQVWRNVGAALHSEFPDQYGRKLWDDWSRKSAKFDQKDQDKTWNAFKADGGITFGTLVHLAGEVGAVNPLIPSTDERDFADAIAEQAKGKLGFDPKARFWWRFTDVIWECSKGDHEPLTFVRLLVDQLFRETNGDARVRKLQKVGVMLAAIRQLQLDSRMHVDETKFDQNPHLLGMANGVVNLATGEFRNARAEDFLTKKTAVAYDAEAECPEFMKFLKAVTKHRKSLGMYLLRVMGYTLTGDTKENKLFMLLGTTRNGKGMLMNRFADLIGPMAVAVNPAMLSHAYSGNPNAPSPALMRLRGARLMLCTELQQGRPLDEAFVKQLTGGDKLAGREGYGQQTEFSVTGKLWISSNHDPEIAYGAEAMWARVVGIPFDVRFEGANDDKDMATKLAAEAPGILALLIKHAKLYLADGLPECVEVVEATNALRDRLDTVKSWIDARCREEKTEKVSADKAYASYKAHIKEVRRPTLNRPAFKSALLAKGFEHRRRNDANYYVGLRLTTT